MLPAITPGWSSPGPSVQLPAIGWVCIGPNPAQDGQHLIHIPPTSHLTPQQEGHGNKGLASAHMASTWQGWDLDPHSDSSTSTFPELARWNNQREKQ